MPDTIATLSTAGRGTAAPFTLTEAEVTGARESRPPALPITEAPSLDLSAATTQVVLSPLRGIHALTATQQIGFVLAKRVLALIAASIVVLIGLLTYMEIQGSIPYTAVTDELIEQVNAAGSSSASINLRREALVKLLQTLRNEEKPEISAASFRLLEDFVQDLHASGRLQAEQLKTLDACVDALRPAASGAAPPDPKAQRAAMDAALPVLDSAELAAVGQGLDLDRLKLLRDIGKDVLDARQSVRSFWLQTAQLVLLNLLLPILTALLGYIFGTQQQRSSAE